jgi:hypothetical protein
VAVLPEDNLLLERANIAADRLLTEDPALDAPELFLLRDVVIDRYGEEIDPIPA